MRSLVTTLALTLMTIGLSAPASAAEERAACPPEILMLTLPDGHESGSIRAMSGQGWVVGSTSGDDGGGAVLWRDGTPTELVVGGVPQPGNGTVGGEAVAVNEDGVIAVTRTRFDDNRIRSISSWLWFEGTASRLPGRRAYVRALNDDEVTVGSTWVRRSQHRDQVPVAWRDGELDRLPTPPDARGAAIDVNERGLIIGWVQPRRGGPSQPWYWRPGGANGALKEGSPGLNPIPVAVDDLGRVVGYRWRADESGRLLWWRTPTSVPRQFGRSVPFGVEDMTHGRDITGSTGGFRGIADRAFMYRLGSEDGPVRLPSPEPPTIDGWANVFGRAVVRGVTSFAPHGGVSVGGVAQPWDGPEVPVIWTCTQTY